MGFEDILSSMFGGFGRPRVPTYTITIDFMEAVWGVEKKVDVSGKTRTIKIPAGIGDGARINFNDFILAVRIGQHEVFERDGADVYVRVSIPYSLAALGGEIKVPTVEGDVKLKVRGGTQPGTMMRLKGEGITKLHGRGKGDEYVRISVETPKHLSRNQKKLMEELRREGL
jgi:DnaJ-class molecular chaperone